MSLSRHKALVLRADEKDPSTAEGLAKGIVTNDNIILKLLCELLWGSGGVPHALSMSLGLVKLEKKKREGSAFQSQEFLYCCVSFGLVHEGN